jgi:hypothetical protein
MKRRSFGLLAGTSLIALKMGRAEAQTAGDPSLLKTTLTPFGAERAGNADGSIPAWTGGYTTVPDGWQAGQFMPNPFEAEQSLVTINAANMAQYSGRLTLGVQAMMTKYGFSIKVYPTHRTQALPQGVYDSIAVNAVNAKLDSEGPRFGFTDAFGGIPFPIPDASDPYAAGAQIIWNHAARWTGYGTSYNQFAYAVSNGNVALAIDSVFKGDSPYYAKGGSLATYGGILNRNTVSYLAPANDVGGQTILHQYSNPYAHPNDVWELLNGQARVRRAPEVGYDTPSSAADGICDYDEYYGFGPPLDRYDWKYTGKREMYIPYHNNTMMGMPGVPLYKDHFLDPDVVRWELHRVWVVEATLHPGERNVMSRRTFYVDEDTWTIAAVETYDANNNLFHTGLGYFYLRPDLPGLILGINSVHNLQTGNYATPSAFWNEKAHPTLLFNDGFPDYVFDPERLAASAQY